MLYEQTLSFRSALEACKAYALLNSEYRFDLHTDYDHVDNLFNIWFLTDKPLDASFRGVLVQSLAPDCPSGAITFNQPVPLGD
jgi:hypothetical protein